MIGFSMLSIITITQDNVDDVLGYAGTLVGDLMPLIVVFLGIAIGAYLINVVITRIRG